MYRKIFRANCLVAVLAVLLCSAMMVVVLYHYFEQQTVEELADDARILAQTAEEKGAEGLAALDMGSRRVTLIAPDGQVLYDSRADAADMENHLDRDEVQEALEGGWGLSKRYSATLLEKTLYYALRLDDGSVLRLAVSDFTVFTLLASVLGPLVLCVALVLALSAVLARRLARGIVRPLNELDLEHLADTAGYDELTPLLSRLAHQRETIAEQLQRAKQQQEEFRLITDNMREGLLVMDEEAKLLTYNGAALRLLDVPAVPAEGNVLQLNHTADFCSLIGEVLKGGHGKCSIECAGRICQVMANPVMGQGRVIGGVIVILDVTEETEREQLRREFTANVSHELKTPLTSISGFAELMREGTLPPEDVADFSSTIYDEAQRLIVLVNDILRLSALDEGRNSGDWENVELWDMAQETLHRLEPAAAKRGIRLSLRGEHAAVRAVRPVLDEMIYNLCDNAIKYNKDNGKVTVTITPGDKIRLEVRDTGIGIPPAHQSRVFERFYRVDKSHSKEIGGTGLGLSIVKHGAQLHGADVTLQSVVGRGTIVVLSFPCVEAAAAGKRDKAEGGRM